MSMAAAEMLFFYQIHRQVLGTGMASSFCLLSIDHSYFLLCSLKPVGLPAKSFIHLRVGNKILYTIYGMSGQMEKKVYRHQ